MNDFSYEELFEARRKMWENRAEPFEIPPLEDSHFGFVNPALFFRYGRGARTTLYHADEIGTSGHEGFLKFLRLRDQSLGYSVVTKGTDEFGREYVSESHVMPNISSFPPDSYFPKPFFSDSRPHPWVHFPRDWREHDRIRTIYAMWCELEQEKVREARVERNWSVDPHLPFFGAPYRDPARCVVDYFTGGSALPIPSPEESIDAFLRDFADWSAAREKARRDLLVRMDEGRKAPWTMNSYLAMLAYERARQLDIYPIWQLPENLFGLDAWIEPFYKTRWSDPHCDIAKDIRETFERRGPRP